MDTDISTGNKAQMPVHSACARSEWEQPPNRDDKQAPSFFTAELKGARSLRRPIAQKNSTKSGRARKADKKEVLLFSNKNYWRDLEVGTSPIVVLNS